MDSVFLMKSDWKNVSILYIVIYVPLGQRRVNMGFWMLRPGILWQVMDYARFLMWTVSRRVTKKLPVVCWYRPTVTGSNSFSVQLIIGSASHIPCISFRSPLECDMGSYFRVDKANYSLFLRPPKVSHILRNLCVGKLMKTIIGYTDALLHASKKVGLDLIAEKTKCIFICRH
jgi:hypothetical protein